MAGVGRKLGRGCSLSPASEPPNARGRRMQKNHSAFLSLALLAPASTHAPSAPPPHLPRRAQAHACVPLLAPEAFPRPNRSHTTAMRLSRSAPCLVSLAKAPSKVSVVNGPPIAGRVCAECWVRMGEPAAEGARSPRQMAAPQTLGRRAPRPRSTAPPATPPNRHACTVGSRGGGEAGAWKRAAGGGIEVPSCASMGLNGRGALAAAHLPHPPTPHTAPPPSLRPLLPPLHRARLRLPGATAPAAVRPPRPHSRVYLPRRPVWRVVPRARVPRARPLPVGVHPHAPLQPGGVDGRLGPPGPVPGHPDE